MNCMRIVSLYQAKFLPFLGLSKRIDTMDTSIRQSGQGIPALENAMIQLEEKIEDFGGNTEQIRYSV